MLDCERWRSDRKTADCILRATGSDSSDGGSYEKLDASPGLDLDVVRRRDVRDDGQGRWMTS